MGKSERAELLDVTWRRFVDIRDLADSALGARKLKNPSIENLEDIADEIFKDLETLDKVIERLLER
jgi:hypothetical protein